MKEEEFGKKDRRSLEKRGRVWEKELIQQEEKKKVVWRCWGTYRRPRPGWANCLGTEEASCGAGGACGRSPAG